MMKEKNDRYPPGGPSLCTGRWERRRRHRGPTGTRASVFSQGNFTVSSKRPTQSSRHVNVKYPFSNL